MTPKEKRDLVMKNNGQEAKPGRTEQVIGLIAPYPDLAVSAAEVRTEHGIHFLIEIGDMEKASALAWDLVRQGIEVIISRGGTAAFLRAENILPVVEIKVTGYDVIRILSSYVGKEKKIAIVGYQNVVDGFRVVSELLGLSIHEFIIPNEEVYKEWDHVRQDLKQLIQTFGIEVVIGDTLVTDKLKLENWENVEVQLIKSGKEAIIQAIEEARQIIEIRNKERQASEKLKTIINAVHDGVVATDEKGRITAVNPIAEEIFRVKEREVVGVPIGDVIANSRVDEVIASAQSELEQLQHTPVGDVVTNRVPIYIDSQVKGVVATFQEVAKLQSVEQRIRQTIFQRGHTTRYQFEDILTNDPHMKQLKNIARKYARTDATILILGESGTGKELFAQSIHHHSSRRQEPFVAVNCSALPGQLLESELFGYVEGAFTGAKKTGKPGLFELAHNGTIFLDEIGDMTKDLQSRLLRVLEEKQVMRLGSDNVIPVNVRMIAATNVDLWNETLKGNFRLDLYYRLNVLNIRIPPLRERKKDISLLAEHFWKQYCKKHGIKNKNLPSGVAGLLEKHAWIGNIRELKNIMERIVLSSEEGEVDLATVALMLDSDAGFVSRDLPLTENGLLEGSLDDIKRKVALTVLEQEEHNISRAAARLQIDRNTLKKIIR